MALAKVLGFNSNDAFNRSLQCEKTDDHIDELCPQMNIENIAQFITLPPYADVRVFLIVFMKLFFFEAGKIFKNG
jgi:hypothetical protein